MTLEKMKKKYRQMQKDKYEMVFISQVVDDLYQVRSMGKPKQDNPNKPEEQNNEGGE